MFNKKIKRLVSPCKKCPYTLGIIKTVISPCPECKLNGYKTYDRFVKETRKLPKVTLENDEAK